MVFPTVFVKIGATSVPPLEGGRGRSFTQWLFIYGSFNNYPPPHPLQRGISKIEFYQ